MHNYTIKTFEKLPSTNLYALENIDSLNNADIIVARRQSQGRGRLQRKWFSDSLENIYLSIVLKPAISLNGDFPLANVTQYMAVVIAQCLETYSLQPHIKWPNDILINNKKIAGILCETSLRGSYLNGIVLGVGFNLDLKNEELIFIDQPATALNIELGEKINKHVFMEQLLDTFFAQYNGFLVNGFLQIKEYYLRHCAFMGKVIKLRKLNEVVEGKALEIDDQGALIFENSINERVERIFTGDLLC